MTFGGQGGSRTHAGIAPTVLQTAPGPYGTTYPCLSFILLSFRLLFQVFEEVWVDILVTPIVLLDSFQLSAEKIVHTHHDDFCTLDDLKEENVEKGINAFRNARGKKPIQKTSFLRTCFLVGDSRERSRNEYEDCAHRSHYDKVSNELQGGGSHTSTSASVQAVRMRGW